MMEHRWREADAEAKGRASEEAGGHMAATVMLVEDERKLRDLVRSYLERAGFYRAVDRIRRRGDHDGIHGRAGPYRPRPWPAGRAR